MSARPVIAALVVLLAVLTGSASAPQPAQPDLERRFTTIVRPFLDSYCTSCHGGATPAAQLDLRAYASADAVARDHERWALVVEKMAAQQMPPSQAKQPDAESRRQVIEWIGALRRDQARKHAGDPGVVLARRLSNAEYNYTIRDLTGVDMRPAREFPVDPANPAGFDNSGESLAMSPALMTKYFQAAREVSNHLVLKPDGLAFAPHPMLVETDRDKYAVNQIIDFYHRQATDYAAYFKTARRVKDRLSVDAPGGSLGRRPKAPLAQFAAEDHVSAKYLATIWRTLEETNETVGPLATLQAMWREGASPEHMRDFVVGLRAKIAPAFTGLSVKGLSNTAQPFLMWRNRQYAASRRTFDRAALQVEGEVAPVAAASSPPGTDAAGNDDAPPAKRTIGPDSALRVPAGHRAQYEAAFARFAAVFPDAFYISERGRYFPDNTRDKGRHLSAGFHNVMGYFRDDQPLYDLILDEAAQKQLDAMWQELDFVAAANIRTYIQFYLNESGEARGLGRESEGPRPTDKDILSESLMKQVEESYLGKARAANNAVAVKAIEEHFRTTNAGIRWVERARVDAEPRHLDALLDFAARAYRRPLAQPERADLLAYYRSLRDQAGLDHEDALRDSVVGVLMSPDFCYLPTLAEPFARAPAKPAGGTIRPLADYALASRLSYSVLDFIYANHTFVNPVLAQHYGMPPPAGGPDTWIRIDDANRYDRGGLLPMSVFLTKNAPGLRTSPVKRGYWVVKQVLGEHIPPPPAAVPELPRDESKLDLPLRDMLARHREDKSCASCHSRFDALGLVFEGYGPVGELRTKDLGGRAVDASASFPGGGAGAGLEGLRAYVRERRQDDFVDSLSRKLLAYALGRSLILPDDVTVDLMREKLAATGYRFDTLIETIVTSPQFLTKR